MVLCLPLQIQFLYVLTRSVTTTCELFADTVEAYENGELAKLLGIDTVDVEELWESQPWIFTYVKPKTHDLAGKQSHFTLSYYSMLIQQLCRKIEILLTYYYASYQIIGFCVWNFTQFAPPTYMNLSFRDNHNLHVKSRHLTPFYS